MASRLQAFATRNQKEERNRAGIGEVARLSRKDIRLHKQRAAQEPTLLDTDVESIGDSTILSGLVTEEHGDAEDPTFQSAVRDPDTSTPWLRSPFSIPQSQDNDEVTAIRQPKYVRPFVYQDQTRHGPGLDQKSKIRPTNAGHESPTEEGTFSPTGQLDEVSVLPELSDDSNDARDGVQRARWADEEETPKRTDRPTREASPSPGSPRLLSSRPMKRPLFPASRGFEECDIDSPLQQGSKPAAAEMSGGRSGDFDPSAHSAALDYTPEILSTMSYEQLAKEDFDYDPGRRPESPADLRVDAVLQSLRDIASSEESEGAKHEERLALFSLLQIQRHEEIGDMILENFASVFKQFQDMRRRKRQMAQEFERRVADREAEVRKRQEALAQSTQWLKKQGEDVIRGPSAGPGEAA
jgi:Extracellular mutant protein 11